MWPTELIFVVVVALLELFSSFCSSKRKRNNVNFSWYIYFDIIMMFTLQTKEKAEGASEKISITKWDFVYMRSALHKMHNKFNWSCAWINVLPAIYECEARSKQSSPFATSLFSNMMPIQCNASYECLNPHTHSNCTSVCALALKMYRSSPARASVVANDGACTPNMNIIYI